MGRPRWANEVRGFAHIRFAHQRAEERVGEMMKLLEQILCNFSKCLSQNKSQIKPGLGYDPPLQRALGPC